MMQKDKESPASPPPLPPNQNNQPINHRVIVQDHDPKAGRFKGNNNKKKK